MTYPNSKSFRLAVFTLLAFAASVVVTDAARADDSAAWTLFQAFLAECKTATSMEQLLPFLAEWRHQRFEASDDEGRETMFMDLCQDTETTKDISFVSEEAKGDATVLHLKATRNDFPMKGKVTVVREDDGLKVDEWFWATGQ